MTGGGLGAVVFYGGLAGVATLAGTYLVLRREEWARKNSILLISFAVGVLLGVAFAHLLPEANALASRAWLFTLGSFLAFYVLEQNIAFHAHHEDREHSLGTTAFLGLSFHSLLDGIIIGAGFEVSAALGIVSALGVISHELPEGISITSILLHAGFDRPKTILYSSIVALATPLGAILAWCTLRGLSQEVLGLALAIGAGSFLYIAASDLIPQTHRESSWLNALMVIVGALVAVLAGVLVG
jgi:zinc and cadmium transporter